MHPMRAARQRQQQLEAAQLEEQKGAAQLLVEDDEMLRGEVDFEKISLMRELAVNNSKIILV